ncbi:MAG: hypothetical protein BA873_12715 [Desulfobulbaceae bacterium C00003063]|nr:MAG: hypothetical protein BA873_12715 [Desulfobulbaceae bacterium C00003063]
MELYQLRTFAAVAKTKHLTQAAEQLAISQPAVSAQIKALEEEFHLLLFVRTSKGMLLTPEGKILLRYAEKVLADSETLLKQAMILQTEIHGTVRLGLNEGEKFLKIEQLCSFSATKYKGLKFHIRNSNSSVILQDISENKLDCGFVFGEIPDKNISGIFLKTQQIKVIAPVAWKERIVDATWEDLIKLPWAWQFSDCPYRRIAQEFLKSHNLNLPESTFLADQDRTIIAFVSSGTTLGMVKESDASHAAKKGKVVIWQKDCLELNLYFVFKHDRQEEPLIQAVLQIVQNVWR